MKNKVVAVVIKHPGRDWEEDVRVDMYEVPEETTTEQIREKCMAKMLGPFQILFVTKKISTAVRPLFTSNTETKCTTY